MDLFINILGWIFLFIIIFGLIIFSFRNQISHYIMDKTGGQGGIIESDFNFSEEQIKHLNKISDKLQKDGFSKEEYEEAKKIIEKRLRDV